MAGWNPPQLCIVRESVARGTNTSPVITTIERGSREGMNRDIWGTCGYARTLCLTGRRKEALHILNQLGIQADSKTYVCLLQECINMKDLAEGKQVHAHIVQSGFKPNIFVLDTLVNMYSKCRSIVDAHEVFDSMSERDAFTWTTMIQGYAKHGYGLQAFKTYEHMQREDVIPNRVTFICVLNACASLGALDKGRGVHADIVKSGIPPDIKLGTALCDMYAKCGSLKNASQVFNKWSHGMP